MRLVFDNIFDAVTDDKDEALRLQEWADKQITDRLNKEATGYHAMNDRDGI